MDNCSRDQKYLLHLCKRWAGVPVFTAALFTIARTWTQPRCSSADAYISYGMCVCV